MTEDKRAKYQRLKRITGELSELSEKIGKLAFFLNENELTGKSDFEITQLESQLDTMCSYRKILQARISIGNY